MKMGDNLMNAARTSLLALSVLALAACSSEAQRGAEQVADNTENAVENTTSAAGNTIANVSQDLTPTPSGQEFVNTAAKSDAFEIAAAKLAATNAQSAEVKSFATMMIEAHTASTAKFKKAASDAQPAITPDPTLTADQNEDLAELKGLKGADFDKEYIDGQVDAHKDALALLRKYADDGTVPPLKTAASEVAPTVETHLVEARKLDKD
jgi:putative membrane protein